MTLLARRLATALLVAAVPGVLAGCAGSSAPTATASSRAATSSAAAASTGPFAVAGKVSAPINYEKGDKAPVTGAACEAAEIFGDIEEGGRIVLTDPAGKTAGSGSLSPGVARASTKSPELGRCEFRFTIPKVTPGSKTYQLAVGDEARGTVPFTRKELEAGPTITVG